MEKPPETPNETPEATETAVHSDTAPSGGSEGGHSDAPRAKKEKLVLTAEMKADPLSKKLILLSSTFASLAVLCIGFLTYTYYQKKHANTTAPAAEEDKPSEVITQFLEEIHVILRNEQDLRAELVVECDQRATCDFIKGHPAQVRDLLIPVLSSVDPDIFSNVEAKQTLRKDLMDRLNTLELPSKVTQIHFNNLSIEGTAKTEKPKKAKSDE